VDVTTDLQPFIDTVIASGLASPDEVEAIQAELSANSPTDPAPRLSASTLSEELVRQGKLTHYQGVMFLQGRATELIYGDYIVLDKLGAGGMATVYKAANRQSGELVAIKVLSFDAAHSQETAYRFDREVQASAKVSHPNIVCSYDCKLQGDVNYLVMEYVDGITLAQHVGRFGTLSVEQSVDCILQAARGLAHAHEKRIVHRDIKPENLLLGTDGTVKILDLGLARFDNAPKLGEKSDSAYRLTQLGVVLGTADFMAPEQSIDARRADYRSDIYALGCTLYFLLVGKSPFGRGTAMATMMAHQTDPIPTLNENRNDVPKALQAAFNKMVAKNPKQRQESMHEVIEDLEVAMGGQRKKVLPPPPPKPVMIGPAMDNKEAMEIVKKPGGRSKWPTIAGAFLGAGLGLTAFLLDLPLSHVVVQSVSRAVSPAAEQAAGVIVPVVGLIFGALIGFVINELI
jgi:eukaryotic-like serine/threonine-protein kinase